MTEISISPERLAEFEKRLGCRFCQDGIFAEMAMPLGDYTEKTAPIDGVTYAFYTGDISALRSAVAAVDPDWPQYFTGDSPVLCGYVDGKPVSFCCVAEDNECLAAQPGIRVGSIGCVGTLPQFRSRGIGLRMVDLATLHLQSIGCDRAYISYTHIDFWYARLGYRTFARFSFQQVDPA